MFLFLFCLPRNCTLCFCLHLFSNRKFSSHSINDKDERIQMYFKLTPMSLRRHLLILRRFCDTSCLDHRKLTPIDGYHVTCPLFTLQFALTLFLASPTSKCSWWCVTLKPYNWNVRIESFLNTIASTQDHFDQMIWLLFQQRSFGSFWKFKRRKRALSNVFDSETESRQEPNSQSVPVSRTSNQS